jgi:dihydropteroate synthase
MAIFGKIDQYEPLNYLMKFDDKKSYIMGILNITPDSFSDGNLYYNNPEKAAEHAMQMQNDGADIIDIGGESSKPGSSPVSVEEELRRVLPVIKILSEKLEIPISIDTYKPEVADKAIMAGAKIINDITGLTNPDMLKVAAKNNTTVIIMHMQGEPKTMQKNPHYENVIKDIHDFFESRIKEAKRHSLTDLILDPGIGFGKTKEHNLTILKHLDKFNDFGYPILVGPSRKSFLGSITGSTVEQRLKATITAVTTARLNGANILRVHDVAACKKALQIADAMLKTQKKAP